MQNEILLIGNIVGMILQSIYYAYFMIATKRIKKRRLLFIISIMIEYMFLKYVCNLNYTINFELMFGILIIFVLKLFYNNKAKITDLITYVLSIIFLGIFSVSGLLILGANIITIFVSTLLAIFTSHLLININYDIII